MASFTKREREQIGCFIWVALLAVFVLASIAISFFFGPGFGFALMALFGVLFIALFVREVQKEAKGRGDDGRVS